jgi:hypothetical protein
MADEEILQARAEYIAFLKLLDDKSKAIMINFLSVVENDVLQNSSAKVDMIALNKAIKTLRTQYTELIKTSTDNSFEYGVKIKEIEFDNYLSKIEKVLAGQKITDVEKKAITSEIKVQFGGGLEAKVIDSVWNKVWPDALNVNDRIARLSLKVKQFTEQTIKQGIILGDSAANIAKKLRDHFGIEGLERKAAFRLAAHTTNMVYQATQAEISIQAKFVMGIRIVRGMWGNISPNCPICLEHGGTVSKEYYKSYFGGRDIDLWVLANMPPYHSNCSCGIEQITEDTTTFIRKAREGRID